MNNIEITKNYKKANLNRGVLSCFLMVFKFKFHFICHI